jgi:hypothetical protein
MLIDARYLGIADRQVLTAASSPRGVSRIVQVSLDAIGTQDFA